MESFAVYAPDDTTLLIKHPPMDRGCQDYRKIIVRQSVALGIESRVLYIHDQNLPTLMTHARGVVLVNGPGGLLALQHGTPLKVCGDAPYDMPGLTHEYSLDTFWRISENITVDADLYASFIGYLTNESQRNGSFYRALKGTDSKTGLVWEESGESAEVPIEAAIMQFALPKRAMPMPHMVPALRRAA